MKGSVELNFTGAVESISLITIYACTAEASNCVSAVGIGVTCMHPQFTLINIYRWGPYHK